MAVVKEEQEVVHSLSDTQLTESHAYPSVDTDNAVIVPLFIITPADVEEGGQPATAEDSELKLEEDDGSDVDNDGNSEEMDVCHNNEHGVISRESLVNRALCSPAVVSIETLNIDSIKKYYTIHDTLINDSVNHAADKDTDVNIVNSTVSKHVCSVCGRQCKYARSLAVHMKAHRIGVNRVEPNSTTKQTYNCSKCHFKTAFTTSLRRHNRLMHENKVSTDIVTRRRKCVISRDTKPTFSCSKCEFKTASSTSLTRHSRLMHELQTPKQNVSSQSELVMNCEDEQGNLLDTSESANITFDSREIEEVLDVEQTDDQLSGGDSTALSSSDNATELKCKVCGKRFSIRSSLTLHMKAHSGITPSGGNRVKPNDTRQTHNCSKCQFRTLFHTSLLRHNRLMHENKVSSDIVTRRRKRVISRDTKPTFNCSKCEFKTASSTSLTRHNRLMHELQTPKQNVSSQNELDMNCEDEQGNLLDTSESANIVLHNKQNEENLGTEQTDDDPCHSNDQLSGGDSTALSSSDNATELKCKVCGKRFSIRSSLTHHMKAHSGMIPCGGNLVKPNDNRQTHNCSKCQFRTRFHTSLLRHNRLMHAEGDVTGDRSVGHVCTICGKRCQFARSLALHMMAHNGMSSVGANRVQPSDTRQTYNCNKCQFKTLFRTSLIRHSRLMHVPQTQQQNVSSSNESHSTRADKQGNQFHTSESANVSLDNADNEGVMDMEQMSHIQPQSDDHLPAVESTASATSDDTTQQTSHSVIPEMTVGGHTCSVCGQQCPHAMSLAGHVEAHPDVNDVGSSEEMDYTSTYSCNKCSFVTSYHSSIVSHINVMHRRNSLQSSNAVVSPNNHQHDEDDDVESDREVLIDDGDKEREDVRVAHDKLTHDNDSRNSEKAHLQSTDIAVSRSSHGNYDFDEDNDEGGRKELLNDAGDEKQKVISGNTNDSTVVHVCTICGKHCKSVRSLAVHTKAHSGTYCIGVNRVKPDDTRQTYNCSECEFRTVFSCSLTRHKRVMHGQQTQRENVSMSLPQKSCLCSVCGKVLYNSDSLKRHVTACHPDSPAAQQYNAITDNTKRSKCSTCQKFFTRPWRHRCRGEQPYCCKSCGELFAERRAYDVHKRSHPGERPFSCKVCDRQFAQLSDVQIHMRTHSEDRPYCCESCGRCFAQRCAFLVHQRIHTREKPFSCKVCCRRFAQLSNVQVHMRTHTGEQPYCCETCGRRFGQLASYQVHMRHHSGIRPFLCAHCAKGFLTGTDLKEHVIVMHTDQKDFQCPVCKHKFALRKAMRRHVKVRHGAQFLDS